MGGTIQKTQNTIKRNWKSFLGEPDKPYSEKTKGEVVRTILTSASNTGRIWRGIKKGISSVPKIGDKVNASDFNIPGAMKAQGLDVDLMNKKNNQDKVLINTSHLTEQTAADLTTLTNFIKAKPSLSPKELDSKINEFAKKNHSGSKIKWSKFAEHIKNNDLAIHAGYIDQDSTITNLVIVINISGKTSKEIGNLVKEIYNNLGVKEELGQKYKQEVVSRLINGHSNTTAQQWDEQIRKDSFAAIDKQELNAASQGVPDIKPLPNTMPDHTPPTPTPAPSSTTEPERS